MNNQIRTTLLLAAMTVFLVVLGNLLGGRQGMILALILAAGMNFFSYWFSDKIVLRMYRANEVSADQAPELYQIVQTLAQRAGLPMPRIFVIPQGRAQRFCHRTKPGTCRCRRHQGISRYHGQR